jgi:hypothetical protein
MLSFVISRLARVSRDRVGVARACCRVGSGDEDEGEERADLSAWSNLGYGGKGDPAEDVVVDMLGCATEVS